MLIKDETTGRMRICSRPTHIRYIDTGKVKIGCAYIPKPAPMTYEAVRIQGALLGIRPTLPVSINGLAMYAALAVVAITGLSMVCR